MVVNCTSSICGQSLAKASSRTQLSRYRSRRSAATGRHHCHVGRSWSSSYFETDHDIGLQGSVDSGPCPRPHQTSTVSSSSRQGCCPAVTLTPKYLEGGHWNQYECSKSSSVYNSYSSRARLFRRIEVQRRERKLLSRPESS